MRLKSYQLLSIYFRVGTYKSAVEPFIRNDMSEPAKSSAQAWLGALWSEYKADIAKLRGFDIENFDEKMDDFLVKFKTAKGDSGQYALDNGWVDSLKTKEEVRQQLIALVGKDLKGKSFKRISLKDYLSTN